MVAASSNLGRRFYYGWWIVFASATIVFLSAGTFFYGFGLLVTPLTAEFGWSRAALSAAFSLRTEVGGVAAPIVGFAVDRVGVRRLLIAGVWVVALGFVLLSRGRFAPCLLRRRCDHRCRQQRYGWRDSDGNRCELVPA